MKMKLTVKKIIRLLKITFGLFLLMGSVHHAAAATAGLATLSVQGLVDELSIENFNCEKSKDGKIIAAYIQDAVTIKFTDDNGTVTKRTTWLEIYRNSGSTVTHAVYGPVVGNSSLLIATTHRNINGGNNTYAIGALEVTVRVTDKNLVTYTAASTPTGFLLVAGSTTMVLVPDMIARKK